MTRPFERLAQAVARAEAAIKAADLAHATAKGRRPVSGLSISDHNYRDNTATLAAYKAQAIDYVRERAARDAAEEANLTRERSADQIDAVAHRLLAEALAGVADLRQIAREIREAPIPVPPVLTGGGGQ